MTYTRVIPRDLFNEAKLLKCLGQLALSIHQGFAPEGLTADDTGDPFVIDQRESDGGLECTSLKFLIGERELVLYSVYNSKSLYPLLCEHDVLTEINVLHDDGSLTDEFQQHCRDIRHGQAAGLGGAASGRGL